jgi:peptidoglycan/xylan/chitin deacetylase (PgdA/CDA1 family)
VPHRLLLPLRGYATAAVLLPLVALADDRSASVVVISVVALAVSAAAAVLVGARVGRPVFAWLGGLVVVVAGWLLPQLQPSPITWLLASAIGVAVGLAVGRTSTVDWTRGLLPLGALVGALELAVLAATDGGHAAAWVGGSFAAAMVLISVLGSRADRRRAGARLRLLAAGTVALTVGVGLWIGANSATTTWFGRQVSHGDRDGRRVAITFDDGPNAPYSWRIARILDAHGAKGTFFLVGKALDARPDIARRLMEDGHLLANHSYHHDSWRWLDPRYPELQRTQDAFERRLGVCPTFYRAPHGQHTPFTTHVVGDHGMTMVGWDVSAGDWSTTDAELVAKRVLDDVEPGSIIVLHDGLDGDVTADRSVLVRALPMILDGLEQRGLEAVSLDELLGKKGYGDHC